MQNIPYESSPILALSLSFSLFFSFSSYHLSRHLNSSDRTLSKSTQETHRLKLSPIRVKKLRRLLRRLPLRLLNLLPLLLSPVLGCALNPGRPASSPGPSGASLLAGGMIVVCMCVFWYDQSCVK